MRKDVYKFLFVGAADDKKRFFSKAQRAGIVEFIDPSARPIKEQPPEVTRLIQANKVLRGLAPAPQEELEDKAAADQIAARIVNLHDQLMALEEEKRVLVQEMERIHVFGDFSTQDIAFLAAHGRTLYFFSAKHPTKLDVAAETQLLYVGSDHGLDYYASISAKRPFYDHLTEMRIDRPLGKLRDRVIEIDRGHRAIEEELKTYAKRKVFLEHALIGHLNRHNLLTAQDHVQHALGDQVFAVEGWVPDHKRTLLARITGGTSVYHEQILIEKADHVPTFLENKRLARVGEDLVHIYDTPGTKDRDPSRWVLWFFAFFFSMILADAGYGLILLLTSLWLGLKMRKKQGFGRRFAKLCLILSVSAIVWGCLTTAFFGIQLSPDNPLRKISPTSWLIETKVAYVLDHPAGSLYKDWVAKYPQLSDVTTVDGWIHTAVKLREGTIVYDLYNNFADSIMLELAIMVGVLHLILSFLRVIDRNWAGIGWILFMVGGYLFFPSILKAVSMIHYAFGVPEVAGAADGLQLIYIGIGSAVLLALIQKRLSGAFELANVIQVFADSLSYLRLYALGLASGMMSATFNDLGSKVGWTFGIIIIIVGHTINIALSIVGGIIHGLRLNFLEWYRHCFDGGGKMLQPLRLLTFK
jgi:V/A-type H+/Na+-transporting ATPase subunit I